MSLVDAHSFGPRGHVTDAGMASLEDNKGGAAEEAGAGGGGGGGAPAPTMGRSKDDAYLLKIRADEFRAG